MRFSSSASSTLPLISAATISLLSSGARAGAVALEYEVVQQNSLASAMMMGLVGDQTVYILDKVEGNFHNSFDNGNTPVWGSFLNLADNTVRATKVETNTFCASGLALGNGTHLVAGGNNAAGIGGATVDTPGSGPYFDYDGRKAIRLLDYQSDPSQLAWNDGPNGNQMQSFRWYPGIEGLADGSIVLIGGYINGGYINRNYPNVDPAYSGQPGASSPTNMQGGSNPTYEHWPARQGDMQVNDFIVKTSGLNSYAHTYLLPSGRMFMQANYSATIWDTQKNSYEDLPDMTDRVVRVYPASGAAAMLPLNKANKYTPTILFCGGTNGLNDQEWGGFAGPSTNTLGITASTDCSSITPENADGSTNQNAAWDSEEQMNQGRTMGQFIHLPNGKMVIVNGANKGTAGYYNTSFNVLSDGTQTEGLAQDPTYKPLLYDPELPKGSRLTDAGFGSSTIARLYHSSALLLPDGSVLVGGSNPHVDVVTNMPTGTTPQAFNTTYELEKWYPSYFFEKRPSVSGVPDSIGYGGSSFNVSVDADYMGDNANFKANATRSFVIRPGFSTHAMNMGQRSIELEVSYEVLDSGNTTFIVNPLPTNPNLVVPGPALFFVTVDGVPSYGKYVMIGDLNGKAVPSNPTIGSEAVALPAPVNNSKFTSKSSGSHGGDASDDGWLQRFGVGKLAAIIAGGVVVLLLLLLGICLWRRKSNNNKAPDHSPLNDNRTSMLGSSAAFAGWNSGDGNGKYNRVNTPSSSVHNLANTPSYGDSYGMTPRSPYLDSPNLHGQDNQSFQSQQRQPSRQDYEGDAGDYYQDNTDSYEPQHQHQASYSAGSNQQGRYSQYGDGGAFYAR